MISNTVSSRGQVTIPREVREHLGIHKGSRVVFTVVGDHVEMRLIDATEGSVESGFGMLRSACRSVPADFDVASVLDPEPDR